MDTDVAAVVAELDDHRTKFEAFCRSLSAEELVRPVPNSTWIVRDFVAHLATIDTPVGRMFKAMHEDGDPSFSTGNDDPGGIDTWNDRQVESRRSWTLDQVFAEAAAERALLHGYLDALTTEDIAKTLKFGGDSKRPPTQIPLLTYLRGWCKHDPMHVVDMLRALPERQTAEVRAWIDDPIIAGYQKSMNPA